jgi:hypothetical protein
MRIITTPVTTPDDIAAMLSVRQEVFENEMGIKLDPVQASDNGHVTYLLARVGPDQEPVGCLCVLDTTNNHPLHEELGLKFDPQARVARYTHLAVLKPYRGMNIPLAMMLEAHRSVIVPLQFDYTWLLFDVERAAHSFLSRLLGFKLLPQTFDSEYGRRRPLVRDENAPQAQQTIDQAEEYLSQCETIAA